jgi:hypothetical protein
MSRRVVSTRFLEEEYARTHAPMYSETAVSLVGRARLAWELAHGASAVAGEPPAIAPNAQGLTGIDMSGPPFGPCLLLPVASMSFQSPNAATPKSPVDAIDSLTPKVLPLIHFWNRPHAVRTDGLSPLSRLQVLILASRTGSGTSTFTWTIENLATTDRISSSLVVTSNGTSNHTLGTVACAPGRNTLRVAVFRDGGSRVWQWRSLMVYVGAKRLHGLTFPG